MGLGLAFRSFFSALGGGETAARLEKALSGIKDPPEVREIVREVPVEKIREVVREVPKEIIKEKLVPDTYGPAQLLALLQQDGRLVDFLNEDIASYADEQIGAAVREIHANCRRALDKYVKLEPVLKEREGAPVTINSGYNPSAIRISGNPSGKMPLAGTVRHRGWKTTKIELPPRPIGGDPTIIFAAEVEVE